MKIKITEGQANRLKLINEDVSVIAKFEEFCNAKVKELNALYINIGMISIVEILNNEISLAKISKRLDAIDSALMDGDRRAYSVITDANEGENLDIRIDNAHHLVSQKLRPLQMIVLDLEKLQELSNEHELNKPFSDVKPIDITPTES